MNGFDNLQVLARLITRRVCLPLHPLRLRTHRDKGYVGSAAWWGAIRMENVSRSGGPGRWARAPSVIGELNSIILATREKDDPTRRVIGIGAHEFSFIWFTFMILMVFSQVP
jgi:hypothetical protein